MVFASPIFLFLFLPVTLAAYYAAPKGWRNGVLLVASLAFYAWGEAPYLVLVIGSVLFNYAIGGAIVGAACYLGLIPFDPETMRFDGIVRRHLEIMTGAGIVAGLIYWMIAGRSAGAWREPRPPLQPPPPLPSHSRPQA